MSGPKTILLDLDGTLLHGSRPLPGAVEAVWQWLDRGHLVGYATNDAVLTVADQASRLGAAGFPLEQSTGPVPLVTAATVTAACLADRHPGNRPLRVLYLGVPAVAVALRELLGDWVEVTDDRPDAVVVGLDPELTYRALAKAVAGVDGGADLLATNTDPWYLDEEGRRLPGAGAVVAAVEHACGRTATVLGKPTPLLFQAVLKQLPSPPSAVHVVVGDSESDMIAGRAFGAICVRVGATHDRLADASAPSVADVCTHPIFRVAKEAIT